MALKETLIARSQNKCEACQSETSLSIYEVNGAHYSDAEGTLYLCEKCQAQIEKKQELELIRNSLGEDYDLQDEKLNEDSLSPRT